MTEQTSSQINDLLLSQIAESRWRAIASAVHSTAAHEKNGHSVKTAQEAEFLMLAADPPPVYKVVLINDDFTPMEFVILILQHFFHLNLDESTRIMLKIHHEGRGICGVYSKDVALTKVDQVSMTAKNAGHPLQCIMEAE
ncbi:MAG: ATP-dependent Clp protease adapter ClpS [Leptothrix ochracea]|uniref:ATP-dependent Clp protease adapter ClpS n=2 Tax=Leptothrix ochracea TaxID=735331 RepID=UPI0034E2A141